ncbi:MAG: hypothetical protein HKO00_05340 [Flavobacteriaceae bacterium]|nr:hypothetical protein [Flavobacteriaceae bacterium]
MKKLLLILITILTVNAYGQDIYFQKPNRKLGKQAKALTLKYNKQLALDVDQELLFEEKIHEFLIRAEEIKKKFQGKEKLDMLYVLQQRETLEMHDILTRPQLLLYKRIKPDMQPLEVVDLNKLNADKVTSMED